MENYRTPFLTTAATATASAATAAPTISVATNTTAAATATSAATAAATKKSNSSIFSYFWHRKSSDPHHYRYHRTYCDFPLFPRLIQKTIWSFLNFFFLRSFPLILLNSLTEPHHCISSWIYIDSTLKTAKPIGSHYKNKRVDFHPLPQKKLYWRDP